MSIAVWCWLLCFGHRLPGELHRFAFVATDTLQQLHVPATPEAFRPQVIRISNPVSGMPVRLHLQMAEALDLRSNRHILRSILHAEMSAEEKTLAIFHLVAVFFHHQEPDHHNRDVHDPVKYFNGYGYCDDAVAAFSNLCQLAGFDTRVWVLEGHVVAEVFFNGRWHMFDPHHKVYFPAPQGGIAGLHDLLAYPDVIDRHYNTTFNLPWRYKRVLLSANDNQISEWYDHPGSVHQMGVALGPGEVLKYGFRHNTAWSLLCFFHQDYYLKYLGAGEVQRKLPRSQLPIHYEERLPYRILGARLVIPEALAKRKEDWQGEISFDGQSWFSGEHLSVDTALVLDFQSVFERHQAAVYHYEVRLSGPSQRVASEEASAVRLNSWFQFAAQSLFDARYDSLAYRLRLQPGEADRPFDPRCEVTFLWQE